MSGAAAGRPLTRVAAAALAAVAVSLAPELRLVRAERPLTDRWEEVPVEARGHTKIGISFRPRQAEALGLEPRAALGALLEYPFEVVRLAAYWDRAEPEPARFNFGELDWQVDAAERAGKALIICTGAVKAFGYPEYFVPAHQSGTPIREGALVTPTTHPELLAGALRFARQVVERYRERDAVLAWQVEHEAFDPLGMEHTWRLSSAFVSREVEAVRAADPARPIVMNGFLPTSSLMRLSQWWRTRDQGDSFVVARSEADIVGIDFYPRHALLRVGAWTLYLTGSKLGRNQAWRKRLHHWTKTGAQWGAVPAPRLRRVMVAEGQAEPWEAVTTPPNPADASMFSCLPEHVTENYNQCLNWQRDATAPVQLWAYLFWGAEYWLARRRLGDHRYIDAFARLLAEA